jgi:pilus assembly protein CpaF
MTQEIFLSYLEPIADRFSDPDVNEIRLRPNGSIYERRRGINTPIPGISIDPVLIEYAVGALSGEVNQPLNHKYPKLHVLLEDWSRVAILAPPIVSPGYAITIRRFPRSLSMTELVQSGTLTPEQAALFEKLIADHKTILLSGKTYSGKTTLARALLNLIPHPGDSLVLIEEPAELNLAHSDTRDIIQIETREETPNAPAFTATAALKDALRHSPDRIILGELRAGEAAVFLKALNTGHPGSLTTVHANSATEALDRLVELVREGDPTQPRDVIVHKISHAIDVIGHMVFNKSTGKHKVAELVRITGVSDDRNHVLTTPLEMEAYA